MPRASGGDGGGGGQGGVEMPMKAGGVTPETHPLRWTPNTWTPNTWTPNTWTPNTWTPNTWTPRVRAGVGRGQHLGEGGMR
jgi:hypothetical protein